MGGQYRGAEVARGPAQGAEVEVAVHPLEIEDVAERLAHANVLEQRPARVEDEAVHPLRGPQREGLPYDPPVADCGDVVAGRPPRRIPLDAEVVQPRLESLEQAVGVVVEVEANLVEVEQPPGRRQIAGPE